MKLLNINKEKEKSNSNGSIQEQFSPITPATTENSELENVNKNPYMEVIYKRLRAMRKRMVRVEKYEEIANSTPDGKNQLNADQLNSLEKKGELAAVIKQSEDILKSMEAVDKEEVKKEKAQKKTQQEENEKAISNAIKEAKNEHTESIIFLLDFFRLVHFQQLNIVQLSELESEVVETLRAKLTTMAEEAKNEELKDQRVKDILDNVNKLQHSDENIIMNLFTNSIVVQDSNNKNENDNNNLEQEITYSRVRSLIQSPPILETTEVQLEQEDIDDDTNNNINQEEFVIINKETENNADNNSTSNINKSDLDQDEKLQIQPEIETSIEETSQNQTVQESVRLATDDQFHYPEQNPIEQSNQHDDDTNLTQQQPSNVDVVTNDDNNQQISQEQSVTTSQEYVIQPTQISNDENLTQSITEPISTIPTSVTDTQQQSPPIVLSQQQTFESESQNQQSSKPQIRQFVSKQLGDTQPPPLTPRNQGNSNRGYRPAYRNNSNRTGGNNNSGGNNNGGYNNNRGGGQSQRRDSGSRNGSFKPRPQ
ncbi:1926_t:CDS:10 [Entrophospora sp. SA101]|nr:1926_t:CDS:10 [Entrophospora sp. SA101]